MKPCKVQTDNAVRFPDGIEIVAGPRWKMFLMSLRKRKWAKVNISGMKGYGLVRKPY